MKPILCTIAVLFLSLYVLVPVLQAQGNDPAAVINAFIAAENARNVDAALALFADDAVINENPLNNPDLIHTGKDEIRAYLQRLVDGFIAVKVLEPPQLVDGKVVWTEENAESALLTRRKVEAVIEKGKIKSITVLDIPYATGRTFPWTGAAGFSDAAILMALGGLGLLGVGTCVLYLSRRSPRAH